MDDFNPWVPGDVYVTSVLTTSIDGWTMEQRRRFIVWDSEPTGTNPRTGETTFKVLVTWGSSVPEYEVENKPVSSAFEIVACSGGWNEVGRERWVRGHISHGPIGKYEALDPRANSVEIMTAEYRKWLETGRAWEATATATERRKRLVASALDEFGE